MAKIGEKNILVSASTMHRNINNFTNIPHIGQFHTLKSSFTIPIINKNKEVVLTHDMNNIY